jgi:hypothetical protein
LLGGCQPAATVVETVVVEGTPQVVEVAVDRVIVEGTPQIVEVEYSGGSQPSQGVSQGVAPLAIQRIIIREGHLTITVDDPRLAREEIESLVSQFASQGAFVISSNEVTFNDELPPRVNMSIRVPYNQFGHTVDFITEMADVVSRHSENAQDVTEEYVDVGIRLEALEVGHDRLLEILGKASSTDNILNIEREVTKREAEINALKGRLEYLRQSGALSLITIEINPVTPEPMVSEYQWLPGETAQRAAERLARNLQHSVDEWIVFVILRSPMLLFLLLLGLVALRWVRKRSRPAVEALT